MESIDNDEIDLFLMEDPSGELDMEGIDDDEIDQYILSEEASRIKTRIWMSMNADHLQIKHKDPRLYVLHYAKSLGFGEKTQEVTMTALRIVQRMKKDKIYHGRSPSSLCGAALLMAARMHDFDFTERDIVKFTHIRESTLRKRLVEFGRTPSSSLTLDELMNVDLEEKQDPQFKKAARARKRAERLQRYLGNTPSVEQT